jgi:purine-binding chemotaxis protein CheW
METVKNKQLYLLHFLVQDTRICIELNSIVKVLPLVHLKAVPTSAPYLAGLMNLAGDSIAVIDLAMRIGLNRKKSFTLDMPILLCSDGQKQFGLIIDEVIGLELANQSALQKHDEFNDPNSPFIASVNFKNDLSLLLNIKAIYD